MEIGLLGVSVDDGWISDNDQRIGLGQAVIDERDVLIGLVN